MNGERYINVLKDHMVDLFNIQECRIFMHDSRPCHKDKKVTKWLQERQIEVLEWPRNSQQRTVGRK